jgi:hypothetical protein
MAEWELVESPSHASAESPRAESPRAESPRAESPPGSVTPINRPESPLMKPTLDLPDCGSALTNPDDENDELGKFISNSVVHVDDLIRDMRNDVANSSLLLVWLRSKNLVYKEPPGKLKNIATGYFTTFTDDHADH